MAPKVDIAPSDRSNFSWFHASMDILSLMQSIQGKMILDLQSARSGIDHNLSRGQALEGTVRKFLREYLPSSIGVTQGLIVDTKGNSSRQIDAILYDTSRTPILYTENEDGKNIQIIPSEGCIAAIEVKTSVTTSDVDKIWTHMESVKSLNKSSYFISGAPTATIVNAHGRQYFHSPTMYFLWVFECPNPRDFVQSLQRKANQFSPEKRIDMALFLDGMLMMNQNLDNEQLHALPDNRTRYVSYETPNALLMWYMMASTQLFQAHIPPINLTEYIPKNTPL